MRNINIEGVSLTDILDWPAENFKQLVLIDRPITLNIGSAEVLGQFAITQNRLIVELAQIDGGGEGVLPAVSRASNHIVKLFNLDGIDCIVHAINCANPNLKLRKHLEKMDFSIQEIPGKGEAYFKAM